MKIATLSSCNGINNGQTRINFIECKYDLLIGDRSRRGGGLTVW